MITSLLTFGLALVAVSAMPAPAATTTPYEAPRPSGVPGGGVGYTYGSTIVGGNAWATGGPAGGEVAGTLLYGSEYQAAGHATGALGPAQGELVGTINPSFAKGCAGAGYDGEGYTQCLQLPPRAAEATPAPEYKA